MTIVWPVADLLHKLLGGGRRFLLQKIFDNYGFLTNE